MFGDPLETSRPVGCPSTKDGNILRGQVGLEQMQPGAQVGAACWGLWGARCWESPGGMLVVDPRQGLKEGRS